MITTALARTQLKKARARGQRNPAWATRRTQVSEIEKGKAQGILAWHPDRLARNSVDGGRIVYLVDIGKIQDLRFPTFRFEASAHGKFMLNIAFSQSKYYVDNLSENIKRGIRQKLRNGMWPNRAPVGYFNDRNNRCVSVDKEKAKLVRKAFELYATGNFPLRDIRKRMDEVGLTSSSNRRMSISNYQWMFNNRFFYGLMEFDGELYEGKHEPIISKRLFDRVQEVMAQKSKSHPSKLKPYLYRGLFRCGECGCFITTETQKGHNYLHCTKHVAPCTQKYVREESIATQVDQTICRVALEAAIADKIVRELENDRESSAKAQEAAVARVKADLTTCEKQTDLLLDMRLNEQISENEYISKKCVLVNEKAELKGKLEAFERNRKNRFEPAIAFIKEAKDATFLLAEGNSEQKRDFLKKIGSNFLMAEKSLAVEFKKPWNLLAEFNSDLPSSNARQREISPKSNWRREWDLNPR